MLTFNQLVSLVFNAETTDVFIQQYRAYLNDEINNWCSDNHMVANTSKTKVILVTNWQKRLSLPADQQ